MTSERRYLTLPAPARPELREEGGKPCLRGYAAVFYSSQDSGTEYQLGPGLRERVMPGCFDRVVKEGHDVRGLLNHDPNHLLGRCSSGTMRLAVDDRGLRYDIDLPDTQAGRDVAEMCRRGDLTGSSFSFRVRKQSFVQGGPVPFFGGTDRPGMQVGDAGRDMDDGDADDVRELHDVDVDDVGPVTFPAYEATTAGLRALGLAAEVRSAWEQWRVAGRLAAGPSAADTLAVMRMRQRLAEAE